MGFRYLLVVTVILLCAIAVFPQAQAAPKAVIYEKKITASPAVQGRGLPIDIECKLGFGGACCYSVYAHDVQAEIILPQNLTLISGDKTQVLTSSGQSSGTIAVDPGGGLTWQGLKWTIEAHEYDEYIVTVYCTGKNELGEEINETCNATITIKSGASISSPVLPHSPIIDKDIIIIASVSSSDSDVANVTLFYSKDKENWISLPMENTQGEVWMGLIPRQKKEGEVYYYMESLDTDAKTFTTETYSLEIKDSDRIGSIKVLTTYGTLLAFVLGAALIIYIGSKSKNPYLTKGLMLLGASLRLSALRALDEIEDDQKRLMKIRKWTALILLVIMIVMLFLAIVTGQLQEVIEHTTNPTEA